MRRRGRLAGLASARAVTWLIRAIRRGLALPADWKDFDDVSDLDELTAPEPER